MQYNFIAQLHKDTSIWYAVFGACALLSFIFRVLMAPLLYIYYGVQYGLGPVEVVTTMRRLCHVGCLAFTLGQLFLLSQVMGLVKKYLQKQSKREWRSTSLVIVQYCIRWLFITYSQLINRMWNMYCTLFLVYGL